MTPKFYHKQVYGKHLFYPDCKEGSKWAFMLKKKALTTADLQHMRSINIIPEIEVGRGYEIDENFNVKSKD